MSIEFKMWMEHEDSAIKIKKILGIDPDFYALKLSTVGVKLGLSRDQILKAIEGQDINRFVHNDTEYLGLPERKKAYDADAKKGINPFEPTYKGDVNRDVTLGGDSRF